MTTFKIVNNPKTKEAYLSTSQRGKSMMTIPQLNKDTAFSEEERWNFGLKGKLPFAIETIEMQAERVYQQYLRFEGELEKNIFLKGLLCNNETLFFYVVSQHMDEMLPVLYTPTVAQSVMTYSTEYRRARGLYIAYPDRHRIKELLQHRTNPEIDLIVASDAEGVLGIGDQGIGGIDIPVAKLMVYTLCAGINPRRYLPVFLDAGTNNQALLDDPLYLGWRHKRVSGEQYDEMIELFVDAVKEAFPKVFLHWEDFGRANASRILNRYHDTLCSFNDDMQGTGAVTVSALLAACNAQNLAFEDQKVIIYGAGTAGMGICEQISQTMAYHNIDQEQARERFYLIDRNGLITDDMEDLTPQQKRFARSKAEVKNWFHLQDGSIDLLEVIKQVKPTTLIGCSTQQGAFNSYVLSAMAASSKRPIIFPLSNPTHLAEATPQDILEHTDGTAMIATGSPFKPCDYQGTTRVIAQCNNALVFPGIGLGVIAIAARKLSDNMIWAACKALSSCAPAIKDPQKPLLPSLQQSLDVSRKVAKAVAQEAIKEGLCDYDASCNLEEIIESHIWQPHYYAYQQE